MPSPINVKNFYTEFGPDYDHVRFKSLYHRRVAKQEEEFIISHVAGKEKVLEVGAGTGRFTQELVKVAGTVLATDISDGMISVLQSKVSSENLIVKQLPIQELSTLTDYGEFDCVICMRVLPHLSDIPGALQQLRGALHEDGEVIFDLWNNNSTIGVMRRIRRVESNVFTQFLSYSKMMQLIRDSALDIRSSTGWGYPHLIYFQWDKFLYKIAKRWAYSITFCAERYKR